MKKVVFVVLVLMLGFTVSAHANGEGACCLPNCSCLFNQEGPLGPPPTQQRCCEITSASNCPGEFKGPDTTCEACCPVPDAGLNQTICADKKASLTGVVTPPVYDSVKWTTSGDGLFTPDNNPISTYTPGSGDIANGSVTLTLTANYDLPDNFCAGRELVGDNGYTSCSKADSLELTINPLPDCAITLDPVAASGSVQAGTQHTASAPSAGAGATYEWVIQDENGNDLITSPKPYGNAVTWVAPQNPGKVWVNVEIKDAGCSCTYDPPIDVKGNGIPVLVTAPVPSLSGWGMAIFTLLLTGVAVAFLRRRNSV